MRGTVACSTDHRLVRSVMHQRRKKARSSTSKSYKIAPKRIELHERHSTRLVGVPLLMQTLMSCGRHLSVSSTKLVLRQLDTHHATIRTRIMWRFKTSSTFCAWQKRHYFLWEATGTLTPQRVDPKEHSCHQKQMVGRERQGDRWHCRPKRHSKLLPSSKGYLWTKLKWPHSTLDGALL